ncbi:hypothetical protein F4677DRAFT_440410 [Hypoxylon crocopeplum]|nr:hypothetical protein F4677DRAFT_440410 [Hypoxylon crocopeplum]
MHSSSSNIVAFVASGNNGKKRLRTSDYPAHFGDSRKRGFQDENLVTVGLAQLNGMRAISSQEARHITTHAPGLRVPATGHPGEMKYAPGTSLGVVIYYRTQQSKR